MLLHIGAPPLRCRPASSGQMSPARHARVV